MERLGLAKLLPRFHQIAEINMNGQIVMHPLIGLENKLSLQNKWHSPLGRADKQQSREKGKKARMSLAKELQ